MGKKKVVWGVILFCIGAIALFGSGGKAGGYVGTCFVFIIVGVVLFLVGLKQQHNVSGDNDSKTQKVKITVNEKCEKSNTRNPVSDSIQSLSEEEKNLEAARLRAKAARLKAETAKLNAEADRLEKEASNTKVCQACGAMTKGNYCEYCGTKLD